MLEEYNCQKCLNQKSFYCDHCNYIVLANGKKTKPKFYKENKLDIEIDLNNVYDVIDKITRDMQSLKPIDKKLIESYHKLIK